MNPKKILITGASGFVGQHLLNYLYQNHDCTLYAVVNNAKNFLKLNKVNYIKVDNLNNVKLKDGRLKAIMENPTHSIISPK